MGIVRVGGTLLLGVSLVSSCARVTSRSLADSTNADTSDASVDTVVSPPSQPRRSERSARTDAGSALDSATTTEGVTTSDSSDRAASGSGQRKDAGSTSSVVGAFDAGTGRALDDGGSVLRSDGGAPGADVDVDTPSVMTVGSDGWFDDGLIRGQFTCYDDGVNLTSCPPDTVPWHAQREDMCLTGETTVDATYAAWGAAIQVTLNQVEGGAMAAFDAEAAGVVGFSFRVEGDTAGLPLRVAFAHELEPTVPSPFVQLPGASSSTYVVLLEDALIPESWMVCSGAACRLDPAAIYAIQFQIVGGEEARSYSFCVSELQPIMAPPPEPEPEPVPEPSGYVAVPLAQVGIAGDWDCYDDGVNDTVCRVGGAPELACIAGSLTLDASFSAWGAGVRLALNGDGEEELQPYDATAYGVVGFRVLAEGTSGGEVLRVVFTNAAPRAMSPFVQLPGPGQYDVLLRDARVPESWDTCTGSACYVDPSSIYELDVQVVGGEMNTAYDYCVTEVLALVEP